MNPLPEYRVLIVEDHSLVCEMLSGMLEQIGCRLAGVAADGEEAVELTRQLRPDVVLMDVDLPGIDGIEAARRITTCCPTPIVVVTAFDAPDLLERASGAGVGAYLGKPPMLLDLERAIAIAIARFADLMALRRLNAEREAVERAAQQRSRELELFYLAAQAFNSSLDLQQVLATVLEEARHVLGVTACSIWLVEPETGGLFCPAASGLHAGTVIGWRLAAGEGLAGWTVQHGESLLLADVQADEQVDEPVGACYCRAVEQRLGVVLRSLLSVPLQTNGRVVGALQAVHTEAGRFSLADRALLESLATAAAAAVENARLYAAAQQELDRRRDAEEALREREAGYRQLAEENARLLQEVNHRVRNNLAALIGLLHAEQHRVPPEEQVNYREALRQLASRIESWAVAQHMLSSSQWNNPSLDELVSQVVEAVQRMVPLGKYLTVDVTPSEVRIPSRTAHNVALLVNELATNTVKHVLRERRAVHVAVDVRREGDAVCLLYRDNGPGYPEEVLRLERSGLGLELVQTIVRHDLQGELALYNAGGAVVQVWFGAPVEELAC